MLHAWLVGIHTCAYSLLAVATCKCRTRRPAILPNDLGVMLCCTKHSWIKVQQRFAKGMIVAETCSGLVLGASVCIIV